MDDLEQALRDLGRRSAHPDLRDLDGMVMGRVGLLRRAGRSRRMGLATIATVASLGVGVVLGGGAGASPPQGLALDDGLRFAPSTRLAALP